MKQTDAQNNGEVTPKASEQPVVKADAKETSQLGSDAAKPDKTVNVPEYTVCMGSEAKVPDGALHAVAPNKGKVSPAPGKNS